MMMFRSRDLNLCISAQAFGDSAMESLKQTVIQQELIFRNQVRELHRLYWTQKNLMNELRRKGFDALAPSCSPWAATTDFKESSEEKKKHNFYMSSSTREMGILAQNVAVFEDVKGKKAQVFSNHERNFSLHLPSDGFIRDTMKDLARSVPVVEVWKGYEIADVDERGMPRPSCKEVINLDDSDELACCEEANVAGGFKSPIQKGEGVFGLQPTFPRDQVSLSIMGSDLGRMPSMIHLNEGHIGRLQEQKPAPSSAELGNSCVTTNSRIKQQARSVPFDLNVPQVNDFSDDLKDPAETIPVIFGSSIVDDGFHKHDRSCNCIVEASFAPKPVSLNTAAQPSCENSADWLICPNQDSKHCGSLDSKLTLDCKNNSNTERTVDNKIMASASQAQAECCGNPVKGSIDMNDGPFVRSKQNAVSIFATDQCKQGKENIDFRSGKGKQRSAVDKRQDSNITSSNSTNLPQKISRDSADKLSNHEGSDEDTLTSHASAQDEAQCSTPSQMAPTRCTSDGITRKNVCSSNYRSAGERATVSNTDDSVTTQVNSPRNEGSSMGKLKAVECDITITAAAEVLMDISLGLSAIHTEQPDGFEMLEVVGDDRSIQHLSSFDSFEYMTLQLSEVQIEDHLNMAEPSNVNETGKNTSGLRLRRGRRLRDFQKEILLGLVSLSRHEICEDLHNIGYKLRRATSRNARENWFVPAKSQRSRLYSGRRRR